MLFSTRNLMVVSIFTVLEYFLHVEAPQGCFEEMGRFVLFCAPFDPYNVPKQVNYFSIEKMDKTLNFVMLTCISGKFVGS